MAVFPEIMFSAAFCFILALYRQKTLTSTASIPWGESKEASLACCEEIPFKASILMAILWRFMLPVAFCFILASPAHAQASFSFNDFSKTNKVLATGDARARNGTLWLTANRFYSHGRMMYKQPIRFCDASGEFMVSFSTAFTFVILKEDSTPTVVNADGLAFTIAPNLSPTSSDSYGSWLGLIDPGTNGLSSNKVVGVEFDTYYNIPPTYPEFNDIDNNHIGLDLNGMSSVKMSSLNPFGVSLHNSRTIAAKIEYDANVQKLKVYASYDTSFTNLGSPVLEYGINLCDYVNESSYVGFSAGAGSDNVDYHNILSWNFSSTKSSSAQTPKASRDTSSGAQTPKASGSRNSKASPRLIVMLSVGCAILLLLAVVVSSIGCWLFHKKKHRSLQSLVVVPHEISYNDLMVATRNFSEDNLLGRGGFGCVYKGVLPEDNSAVAVKRISQDSVQGEREFLAEVKIITNLSHRNLVKLRGWCRQRKELILVYEYMPQGSLDKALFKNESAVLDWNKRYRILCGLAAALVYLHEEWERQVVHRDVKSSNVMLDVNYNARLGDFGLARVVEHNRKMETTTIAGTLGYLAPELSRTHKFTPASDTFSFGIVALETMCGKEATAIALLLPWVQECYATNRLLDLVDPRLNGMCDLEEMLRVLKTALMCTDSQPGARPTMRQVLHILQGETAPPDSMSISG